MFSKEITTIIVADKPNCKHPIILVKRLHRTSVVRDFADRGSSKLHQLHSGLETIKISIGNIINTYLITISQ